METKNKHFKLEDIRRRLYFPNHCYVDPIGLSGGLALWWSDEVNLQVRHKSSNIFRCIFSKGATSEDWLATFVYALSRWPDRQAFWKYLKKIALENKYPWLCIGDLNEVGMSWEKQGSVACNKFRMEQFQDLLAECAFMDLEFKGAPYTWTNNKKGSVT